LYTLLLPLPLSAPSRLLDAAAITGHFSEDSCWDEDSVKKRVLRFRKKYSWLARHIEDQQRAFMPQQPDTLKQRVSFGERLMIAYYKTRNDSSLCS
jgi:hypothetical protein